MSNEIKNQIAVELSDSELDTVAGGIDLFSGSLSAFSQEKLLTQTATAAGPNGAGTVQTVGAQDTSSIANNFLGISI
jgi:hypothetical protein